MPVADSVFFLLVFGPAVAAIGDSVPTDVFLFTVFSIFFPLVTFCKSASLSQQVQASMSEKVPSLHFVYRLRGPVW